jgi:hypothetical protein
MWDYPVITFGYKDKIIFTVTLRQAVVFKIVLTILFLAYFIK